MKCFEINLSNLIKVTMLNKSVFSPPQRHVTRHTREYIVYFIKKGTLLIESDGIPLKLEAGDIYIFNKGTFQKAIESTNIEFYFIHFITDSFIECEISEEEYYSAIRKKQNDFVKSELLSTQPYNHIKAFVKQYIHIDDKFLFEHIIGILKENFISYENNSPETRLNISNAVASLLMKLEIICLKQYATGFQAKTEKTYETVGQIYNYIALNFKKNFTSSDIEKELLINFDYANRIFKREFGYSIINYRNKLRIDTAKILINEKSLDTLASELGFCDKYYFSKCFKRYEGVSPAEFKKLVRNYESE